MRLTLVLPGLLDVPDAALGSADAGASALARLVACDGAPKREDDGVLASVCRACGLARQLDWPVAPRIARTIGIDPGDAYWLCAEPVTLVAGGSDVRLSALVDDLDSAEARALVAMLNTHFAADGVEFIVATAARWLARARDPQRLATRPPQTALGAPILAYLPRGDDAALWRRRLTESQMLFFEHEVNVKREALGRPAVTSVWFWGGGTDTPSGASAGVFARESPVRELARELGAELAALPKGLDALPKRERAAVFLDPIAADDATQRLATIDRDWMAPIERALHKGKLASVEIVIAGCESALVFRPQRASFVRRLRDRASPPRYSQLVARRATGAATP